MLLLVPLKLAPAEAELFVTSVTLLATRIESLDLTDGQRISPSLLSCVHSSSSWELSYAGQSAHLEKDPSLVKDMFLPGVYLLFNGYSLNVYWMTE